MSKIGTSTHLKGILGKISYTKEVMNVISGLKRFDSSEVATQRLKIIRFYDTHGEKTTLDAFGVGRKTIYVWKKRLSVSKRKLTALIQSSTKPKCVRRIATDPKIISFIRNLREKYPRLGKEKIYPLLVAYCTKEGIKPIKESTIGKVIKRNSLFYQKQGKMYHNPNSKYATNRHKTKRQRVKYAPKPKNLGHIQMDTIARFEDGKKFYFYSFIDTKGKFALSLPYKRLNSANTVDFFKKLLFVCPFPVKSAQTDNGLEFLGEFETYLKSLGIDHLFTYPRCPKINGVIERFNRTIQEDFVDQNLHLIHQPQEFSLKLAQYLLFFNSQRVHEALNYMTPLDYLIQKGGMSKKYWSRTIS